MTVLAKASSNLTDRQNGECGLQNRVFRAIGNLDRCTQVRELRVAFKVPKLNYAGHRQRYS
jgi:hypothetical protein